MIKLSKLFEIKYWVNLELNALNKVDMWINFVSRTMRNNWVSAIVEKIDWIEAIKDWTITVSAWWSVLEAFLQPKNYYSWRDLFYLTPKIELSEREKIFYCICIRSNKFKYSYWRQANTTLKDLLIPSKEEIPYWVYTANIPNYLDLWDSLKDEKKEFKIGKWKYFLYPELFILKRWKWPLANFAKNNEWETHFISATEFNNWVSYLTDYDIKHKWNVITVANNWSIWEAFYQEKWFCATSDVTVLDPKFEFNKYIAIFLITIIRKEKYRFNYWKKWGLDIMKYSKIKLPVDDSWNPDFQFMENYIKSLSYSKYL